MSDKRKVSHLLSEDIWYQPRFIYGQQLGYVQEKLLKDKINKIKKCTVTAYELFNVTLIWKTEFQKAGGK